jgi:hypothetical protein
MDAGMGTTARSAAFSVVVAFATAACSVNGFLSADSTTIPIVQPQATDRLHRQAQEALDRWAQAVKDNGGSTITFTGALTSQIGDWESAVATKDKAALLGGAIVASSPLSENRPGKREIRWTDGPKVDAQVLSAAQALQELIADVAKPCKTSCTPLEVTDANLATSLAETSTGPAEVPTWVFTLQGTAVRITRVAVDRSVTVTPGPWNVDDPPVGISIVAARGEPDSATLEVDFVGAQAACKIEYRVEPVESDQAVVVIVAERPETDHGCPAIGVMDTVEVTLGAPLGDRVVLEGRQGLPVPVSAQ